MPTVRLAGIAVLLVLAVTAHAHAQPRSLPIARLTSADLRAVAAALAAPLGALQHAAPGKRRVRVAGTSAPVGRTYTLSAVRVAGAHAVTTAALTEVMQSFAHPDPDDEAWYDRHTAITGAPTAASLALAFHTDSSVARPTSAESAALAALTTALLAAATPHAQLALWQVQCGWGDVVGAAYHGLAIVDTTTHELLWLHTDEAWYDAQ